MSNPFKQFGTDTELEKTGVWLNFGAYQIKVARAGGANSRFLQVQEDYFKPHKRAAEAGVLPEDVAKPILIKVYADSVVLAWRQPDPANKGEFLPTIPGPDDEPLPYTRDNVIMLLMAAPDLFFFIKEHAERFQNFKAIERIADAKN